MHNENSDFLVSTSYTHGIGSSNGPKNESSENARETRSQKAGGKSPGGGKEARACAPGEKERQKTGGESQPEDKSVG